MLEWILVGVVAIVVVAMVTAFAPRLGVAGPLILVAIGVLVALLPFTPDLDVDPELILVGVLPPLLYAASVRLPAVEFRRDFRPIAGLAVFLVVISSLILGGFFFLVIPGIGFAAAVALGAILSPTDAVATSIAKRLGLSERVVTMLEGESLLNDATSLVLLRTAVAAIAGGFALVDAVWDFAWGVFIAAVVGAVLGYATLRLRAFVTNSAAATAISFTVPYIAYLPTEQLGGSGLVAAVVAGIVTGQGRARWFTPEMRISDQLNWRTIELMLEGGVFLLMGLELLEVVSDNERAGTLWHGTWLALAAFGIILVVRIAYVASLVWAQHRKARRRSREDLERMNDRLDEVADRIEAGEDVGHAAGERGRPGRRHPRDPHPDGAAQSTRRLELMRRRVGRAMRDLDYYQSSPLGWRHGTVIVWAGMRGVVTIAAVQTLPQDVAERPLLILVAFLVAALSLMLQGFTLPWLLRALRIGEMDRHGPSRGELLRLEERLTGAATAVLDAPDLADRDGQPYPEWVVAGIRARLHTPRDDDAADASRAFLQLKVALNRAQREELAALSRGGEFSTAALRRALAELDAEQMSIQLRLDGED